MNGDNSSMEQSNNVNLINKEEIIDDRKKVTQEQLALLIEELEMDPTLSNGRVRGMSYWRQQYMERWISLAKKLNSVEGGALRNVNKWQQTWRDWKSNVKRKAKSGANLELNSLEVRVLKLCDGEPPEVKTGGIETHTITEVDPLDSEDSDIQSNNDSPPPKPPLTMYTNEGKRSNPDDETAVIIKRNRIETHEDNATNKQLVEISSRLSAVEASTQEISIELSNFTKCMSSAMSRYATAIDQQTSVIERLAGAFDRQTNAFHQQTELMNRMAELVTRRLDN